MAGTERRKDRPLRSWERRGGSNDRSGTSTRISEVQETEDPKSVPPNSENHELDTPPRKKTRHNRSGGGKVDKMYMTKKGAEIDMQSKTNVDERVQLQKTVTDHSQIIKEEILKGQRLSQLIKKIPGHYNQIAKLMFLCPRRSFRTYVLYLNGPTGTGKATMMFALLESIAKELDPDFYCKSGSLKKFWDMYNNQHIAWIDDPVGADPTKNQQSIQQLKNLLSTGHATVEIKYGTMVFDTKLVIITSNWAAVEMAI